MSDFGDWDDDDALDHEPPDHEQVTYKLHDLRVALDEFAGANGVKWDDLTPGEQSLALALGQAVVDYVVTANPDLPEDAAKSLHNVRRYLSGNTLPAWDDMPQDDRDVGTAIMVILLAWLQRQGAI